MLTQELQSYLKRQDMHCKLERIREGLINAVEVEGFDDDHRHGVEEVGLGWEVDGGGEDAAVDGGGEEDGQEVDDEMVDVEVEEDEVQDVPSSGEEVDKAKDEMGAKGAKGVKGGKARYVAPWGKQRSHGSKADWIVSTDKWGGCRYKSGWYWLHGAWYPYPG